MYDSSDQQSTEPSLFRRDAIDATRSRLGSPVGAVGLASWLVTAFIVLLLCVAIIFLCTARYARKETVTGVLEPSAGALRIASPRAATIAQVHVQEGQQVARGQPLVTLDMDPTVANGRRLGEILADTSHEQEDALSRQIAARRQLLARQRDELAAQRDGLIDRGLRLKDDEALQVDRVRLAKQTAAASQTLWEKELMSAVQYRQREDASIAAQQQLLSIQKERAAIPFTLAQMAAQERRLIAESEDAAAAGSSSVAQLKERRANVEAETRIILVAQEAGQIAALQAKPGAPTLPGASLAILLPRGVKLQADLWIPSRAAGFVAPGDKVRLMYDAFPYQRFGVGRGTVTEVAHAPTAPTDLPTPIRTEEALYRVRVALADQSVRGYGQAWPLSPGMKLNADVVLEQQSLFAWLFDKIRAASARAKPL